ncbi:transposase DDE domain protein [Leptospira kirschneri str. H1]|uniref:Transposase DDE domain protein n=1 Tax=Leptospira kirschneri str. H1 TaxID=1049966 RepID=A0A0E2BK47_9LEPT|nr:transposase DDE domain protein [Leptospira kirschneri str. H1]
MVHFHLSHYREFKNYYLIEIKKNLKSEFPKAVSYNRFVELMPNALTVIASFLSNSCLEKCSGISFIDSTILKVCDNSRIHSHKNLSKPYFFFVRKAEAEQKPCSLIFW